MSFVASKDVNQDAMAQSMKLSDYVLETFKVKLDWTDESIEKVDELLEYFHRKAQEDEPTEAQVFAFAKGFGSYIGEVYRRNHGAEWGFVTLGGESVVGLRSGNGIEFWPWSRAQQRIVEGPSKTFGTTTKHWSPKAARKRRLPLRRNRGGDGCYIACRLYPAMSGPLLVSMRPCRAQRGRSRSGLHCDIR